MNGSGRPRAKATAEGLGQGLRGRKKKERDALCFMGMPLLREGDLCPRQVECSAVPPPPILITAGHLSGDFDGQLYRRP